VCVSGWRPHCHLQVDRKNQRTYGARETSPEPHPGSPPPSFHRGGTIAIGRFPSSSSVLLVALGRRWCSPLSFVSLVLHASPSVPLLWLLLTCSSCSPPRSSSFLCLVLAVWAVRALAVSGAWSWACCWRSRVGRVV